MKLIKYFLVLHTMLLVSCQPDEEYVLVKNEFFSEAGLKKWNAATNAALDSFTATYGEKYKIEYIQHSWNRAKDDTSSLNLSVLLRESYVDFIRKSNLVGDSIPYDTFFIVERHESGEEIYIARYLIINKGNSSTYFYTRYGVGEWHAITSTKDTLNELDSFFEEVPSYTKDYTWGGEMEDYLVITKVTGSEVASKVYTNLSREHYLKLRGLFPDSLYGNE